MPFANKFRAMLDLPFPGDTLGDAADGLTVESIAVGHEGRAAGLYAYPLQLVLCGPGGLTAVKRAIKALFARRCTTFSGYGTPYQLWLGQPSIEPLGDGRYAVTAEGVGARVHLEQDLLGFAEHLAREGLLVTSPEERAALVAAYLDGYRAEVQRLVGRYKTRLRRSEAG